MTTGLLGVEDPSPVIASDPGNWSHLLFIGDHAGDAVPASLHALGLPPEAFGRHIAVDIGIRGLGERLAPKLASPFIRQSYSRLVIDCNRWPDAADSVPPVSDRTAIPGNQDLEAATRLERRRAIFDPYHARITAELDRRAAANVPTVLVSLHSFTPVMGGQARPWRTGVLHQDDSPFSAAVLALLQAELGEPFVGDNQPYSLCEVDHTIPFHRRGRDIDYLELEVRQDLLADAAGQLAIAGLLARILPEALARAHPGWTLP